MNPGQNNGITRRRRWSRREAGRGRRGCGSPAPGGSVRTPTIPRCPTALRGCRSAWWWGVRSPTLIGGIRGGGSVAGGVGGGSGTTRSRRTAMSVVPSE